MKRVLVFAALFVFALIFLSFCYGDTISITRYELGFAQSILTLRLHDMYGPAYDAALNARALHLRGQSRPSYDLPLNIVLGLWGLPLYLYRTWTNCPYDFTMSFWQMLYGKLLFALCLLIDILLVYKACKDLDLDDSLARVGAFLFFTSSIVTSSVAQVGQCDVIGMIAILCAFRAFIRDKNFLLWFMLAMPFKLYAFFILFPLMLLREKRVSHIIMGTLFVTVPTLACNIALIKNPAAMAYKAHFGLSIIKRLTRLHFPLVYDHASVLVILFGIVCVFCFFRNYDQDKRFALFIALLSSSVLFVSFDAYAYWFVYLAPFLAIACVSSKSLDKFKHFILFETLAASALMAANFIQWWWFWDINTFKNMLLFRLLGNPKFRPGALTFKRLADSLLAQGTMRISEAVFTVCLFTCVYLTYTSQAQHQHQLTRLESHVPIVWLVWRLVINSVICLIPTIISLNAIIS